METLSDYISKDLSNPGPPRNRPVCLKTKFSDRKILQLEGRPTVSSHVCVSTEVAQHGSMRISSLLPDCKSDSKINRASYRHNFDYPIVDKSSVVSPTFRTSGSKPNKNPIQKETTHKPQRGHASTTYKQNTEVSGMENIRKKLQDKGISERTAKLITAARSSGTRQGKL